MSDDRKTTPPSSSSGSAPVAPVIQSCPSDNPNAGSKTTGNRIDIEFDPAKSTKAKKCSKIVHVQFVRRFTDGTFIKGGDYASSLSHIDTITTDKGWNVDSLASETSPDYQQGTGEGKQNGSSTKAKMSDAPQTGGGKKGFYSATNPDGIRTHKKEFITYAYCMQGPDCGEWYEGMSWEYVKTWEDQRDGRNGTSRITNTCLQPPPPAELLEAFNKFNKTRGFIPCK